MSMNPAAPAFCAVCDRRPCKCNVDVLAVILRDAARIPRADGVTIVGVRGAAEDTRREGDAMMRAWRDAARPGVR